MVFTTKPSFRPQAVGGKSNMGTLSSHKNIWCCAEEAAEAVPVAVSFSGDAAGMCICLWEALLFICNCLLCPSHLQQSPWSKLKLVRAAGPLASGRGLTSEAPALSLNTWCSGRFALPLFHRNFASAAVCTPCNLAHGCTGCPFAEVAFPLFNL